MLRLSYLHTGGLIELQVWNTQVLEQEHLTITPPFLSFVYGLFVLSDLTLAGTTLPSLHKQAAYIFAAAIELLTIHWIQLVQFRRLAIGNEAPVTIVWGQRRFQQSCFPDNLTISSWMIGNMSFSFGAATTLSVSVYTCCFYPQCHNFVAIR